MGILCDFVKSEIFDARAPKLIFFGLRYQGGFRKKISPSLHLLFKILSEFWLNSTTLKFVEGASGNSKAHLAIRPYR